jgi:hypothetical protein
MPKPLRFYMLLNRHEMCLSNFVIGLRQHYGIFISTRSVVSQYRTQEAGVASNLIRKQSALNGHQRAICQIEHL